MSVAGNLRRIKADLEAVLAETPIDLDGVRLAARRIGTQAEMLEEGLYDD